MLHIAVINLTHQGEHRHVAVLSFLNARLPAVGADFAGPQSTKDFIEGTGLTEQSLQQHCHRPTAAACCLQSAGHDNCLWRVQLLGHNASLVPAAALCLDQQYQLYTCH
jgi:hypothetical protein